MTSAPFLSAKPLVIGIAAGAALAASVLFSHRPQSNMACVSWNENGMALIPVDSNYPLDKVAQLRSTGPCP